MEAVTHSRVQDEAEMWVDLLTSELRAQSAQHEVTKRADLYLRVGGLPLDRVLDALKIDANDWAARLEDLEAWRTKNRQAYDESRNAAS